MNPEKERCRQITYFFVEHAIVLIDICDIALVMVGTFAREFALLVNTNTIHV